MKLAKDVVKDLELKTFEGKLDVKEQYKPQALKMIVDLGLLKMVIENLLSNAIKYTSPKGHVTLSLTTNKETLLISVRDTGYGIAKKDQAKIFTKLFRTDNAKEKQTEGTGLGPYIAKAIVEQTGGKIWFDSKESQGSTFYVNLPLSGMKSKTGAKHLA